MNDITAATIYRNIIDNNTDVNARIVLNKQGSPTIAHEAPKIFLGKVISFFLEDSDWKKNTSATKDFFKKLKTDAGSEVASFAFPPTEQRELLNHGLPLTAGKIKEVFARADTIKKSLEKYIGLHETMNRKVATAVVIAEHAQKELQEATKDYSLSATEQMARAVVSSSEAYGLASLTAMAPQHLVSITATPHLARETHKAYKNTKKQIEAVIPTLDIETKTLTALDYAIQSAEELFSDLQDRTIELTDNDKKAALTSLSQCVQEITSACQKIETVKKKSFSISSSLVETEYALDQSPVATEQGLESVSSNVIAGQPAIKELENLDEIATLLASLKIKLASLQPHLLPQRRGLP